MAGAGNSGSLAMSVVQVGRHEGVVICFSGQGARAAGRVLGGLGFRAAMMASNKICHDHQPSRITMVA